VLGVIGRIERRVFARSEFIESAVPALAETFCESCVSNAKSLSFVAFEYELILHEMGKNVFRDTRLTPLVSPRTFPKTVSSAFQG
jgi:hypothetical protein